MDEPSDKLESSNVSDLGTEEEVETGAIVVDSVVHHALDESAAPRSKDETALVELQSDMTNVEGNDHCDEKVLNLNNNLKVALKEIIAKDNLVRQHAKVAEEAISGWEKAEAEAALLKQQLDNAVQQKLALEERTSHLDVALKECMKQMRNGRDEQDNIQEELVKKTKEWDKLRFALETKVSEAEQQLLAATTNNAVISESFEQRISDAKCQAEAEVKRALTKVEAVEKENMNLKHELRTLKKEMVALNGESKKAAEIAKQQHAESTKKVTRLEAECQKLRSSLRKKGSGPPSLQGEILDRDSRRKSMGRLTSSLRAESMEDGSEISNREMDDKWFALEEEARVSKEALAKRNKELQAARLMCARTAKIVEEALCGTHDISTLAGLNGCIEALRTFGSNQPASIAFQGSCNGHEEDAWASGLVGEHAQLKKENLSKPDKLLDTTSFDLMNDFLEMEKLTCTLPHENGQLWEKTDPVNHDVLSGSRDSSSMETLVKREKELDAANQMCMALNKKVTELESQLNTLRMTDAANGSKSKVDFGYSNGTHHLSPRDFQNHHESDLDSRFSCSVSKIIRVIELLAQAAGAECEPIPSADSSQLNGSQSDSDSSTDQRTVVAPGMRWKNNDFDITVRKLVTVGNTLLQGNADIVDFMTELASTLDFLTRLGCTSNPGYMVSNSDLAMSGRGTNGSVKSDIRCNVDVENDVIRGLEEKTSILESDLARLERDSLQMRTDKEAAESNLGMANEVISRLKDDLSCLQENLAELKAEKLTMENELNAANTNVVQTNAKVSSLTAECDLLRLQKLEVSTVNLVAEQLRAEVSRIAVEKETAERLKAAIEEDLNRAVREREAAEENIKVISQDLEEMKSELAEVKSAKERLDEKVKSQLSRIALLENEQSQGRLENSAARDDFESLISESAQLKSEKQVLENDLFAAKAQLQEECSKIAIHLDLIAKLEEDLRKSSLENEESKGLVEELRAELGRLEEDLQRLRIEKAAAENGMNLDIEKMVEESAQVGIEKEELEHKLNAANERLQVELSMVAAREGDINRLELQNVKLEHCLSQSGDNLKAQQASFISLQGEFYQLKIDKEDLEQSLSMADQSVQQLRSSIAALEQDCSRLKAENALMQDGFNQDFQRVKGDFDRSDKELRLVTTEKQKLFDELSASNKILQQMKAEYSSMETELSILKSMNEEAEQKLNAATENIRRVNAECSRLECEKIDLEQVLAATNEIIQGVKAECSRLSDVDEELKLLKIEKEELERSWSEGQETNKAISAEMKKLEAEKVELEHDLALSQVTWKSQVFEAEEVVASLRAELALAIKSKQLTEDQLGQSFSSKAELQYQVKAALHEASQLEEKTKVLEVELEKERARNQTIVSELEDFRQRLSRGEKTESAASSMIEGDNQKSLDVAAKLDECHRAIISLGQQLQTFTVSRSSLSCTEQTTSEESINTAQAKEEAADGTSTSKLPDTELQAGEEPAPETGATDSEGKVFVPSIPLEGRPRSKSTSPAKSKAKTTDLSKSLDMGSPSEKPSSSSAFSRFFRSKGSSHHHS